MTILSVVPPLPADNADVRAQLNALHLTDTGNGEAFALLHRDRLRYYDLERVWYYHFNSIWVPDRHSMEVMRAAKETAQTCLAVARSGADEERVQYYIKLGNLPRLRAMIWCARGELAVTRLELQNLRNGDRGKDSR